MKRFLLFSMILLSLTTFAQNKKVINGRVYDEAGLPVKGSIISPIGGTETFAVQADGSFSISVDVYCRMVKASAPGYIPVQMEVDGSYLIFKLKVDKDAQERAEKEKEAARQKAEEERIAKEKAEEAARIKAENERIAKEKAEETARIQAEKERIAKEKAEEAARVKAEKERIAKEKAEEAARIKAEKERVAKEKAEEVARIKAEKKQAKKDHLTAVNKKYNDRFRNKGLVNSLEFSYNYQLTPVGNVIFNNIGFQSYENMNPITAEYLIGYRFNAFFELNAGVGFHYNISNLYNVNDQISTDLYGKWNYRTWDIPVLLNMKVYCSRTKVQPTISVSGGYYCMSQKILYEAGLGCNFRISKRSNCYILATIKSTPWPEFNSLEHNPSGPAFNGYNRYKEILSPGIKIGFSL